MAQTLTRLFLAGALAGCALMASPAMAQSAGDMVTGTLAFGPNGSVKNQAFNPSVIVAPGQFSYTDVANTDTALFGLNSLTITDNVFSNANGFEMTFIDTTHPFTGLSLISSTFSPGLTYNFTGGKLTFDWLGTSTAGLQTATFSTLSQVGAVPEPATWAMMLIGVGAVGFAMRRQARSSDVKFNTRIKQIVESATG